MKQSNIKLKSSEEVSRIARLKGYKNKVNPQTGDVKHSLFCPTPTNSPDEISVIHTTKLKQSEISEIASICLNKEPIVGWAVIKVENINEIKFSGLEKELSVIVDGNPHPRHANIRPIPSDRSLQRRIAIELAEASKFVKAA
ncbi:MAG: hypothetical protein KAJ75_07360 [Alphaproteobacteria bacterium]|nr:hypothetical protein [Alphaproteobacteria bacterium]